MPISRSIAQQMTGISWTDFTTNFWTGCSEVEPRPGARSGCEICYARTFAGNRLGQEWGAHVPRIARPAAHSRMRHLNRVAAETGHRFSVFSLSLGDWLDPEVPSTYRDKLIDTVEECTSLTWLLLTHRPHLVAKLLPSSWRFNLPDHIWPGVTVDHPLHAQRWNQLRQYWGYTARAWISAEPLAASLAGADLTGARCIILGGASNTDDPTWEFNPAWVDEMIEKYGEERVYFKQYGDFRAGKRVGKKAAGRDIEGRIYDRTPWPRHRELLKQIAGNPASKEMAA